MAARANCPRGAKFVGKRSACVRNLLKILHDQYYNQLSRCRILCKKWRNQLRNEIYWKIKYQQYFPNYLPDSNGTIGMTIFYYILTLFSDDYFRVFVRGGVHLVQTLEQFKKYYKNDDPSHNFTWFMHRATVRAQILLLLIDFKSDSFARSAPNSDLLT